MAWGNVADVTGQERGWELLPGELCCSVFRRRAGCGAFLRGMAVVHSCGALLWGIPAAHPCSVLPWSISVVPCCGASPQPIPAVYCRGASLQHIATVQAQQPCSKQQWQSWGNRSPQRGDPSCLCLRPEVCVVRRGNKRRRPSSLPVPAVTAVGK